MTESVINSQDIRQYWSTQDRVNHWVEEHNGVIFSSPNIAPSELDGEDGAPSGAASDVESSHSLPPRLMLRYPDGTEIAIPHPSSSGSPQNPSVQNLRSGKHSSSGAHSSNRSRTGSAPSRHSSKHPQSPLSDRHERERERLRSRSPEEIRILPSNHTPETGSRAATHTSHPSHQTRSRSLPRDAFQEEPVHDPMPFTNSHPHSSTSPNGAAIYPTHRAPIKLPRTPPPDPKMHLARSQPPAWHPYTNGSRMTAVPMNPHRHVHNPKHVPPSIVYAPSNHSRNQYNPPTIYSYPPNFGPDGVMYSHSVPPTRMYRNVGGTPYPSAGGAPSSVGYQPPPPPPVPPGQAYPHRSRERSEERGRASGDEGRHVHVSRGTNGSSKSKKSSKSRKSGHDRSKSLPLQDAFRPPVTSVETPPRSRSPAGSDASGSTYYVLPTRKQKVHVLRPNETPGSIRTATSSTKSPTTPISPAGSMKKPFFARLRGLAGRLSSSGGSHKSLERRHSTGNSNSSRDRES
ncbi:hypothetical protein PM082_006876 [Marasmius tenuissimus]|nr:hypothetical protein PM082_013787 [Marasmius tenuissimus]KAJ8088221.1 hypothetical protein PM082_013772 [Marasmius tenuissimus]KAJ8092551.1 hypothetical protein PM082_006876 [Marasmius tenuissimus]